MARAPTSVDLARRESIWRDAIASAENKARRRLSLVATRLDMPPSITPVFVHAGLEIARQFAAESTYANYEHRTGSPWPEEWRGLDDEERESAWRLTLEQLETVTGEAGPD